MRIHLLTMFPGYFEPLKNLGVLRKLFEDKKVEVITHSIHGINENDFKGIDSPPYGGGAGMLMRADRLKEALNRLANSEGESEWNSERYKLIFLSPRGKIWDRELCDQYVSSFINNERELVFLCGRYEGVDERFLEKYVDEEISIGDFILTGGELALLPILDSILRKLPEALGNSKSACHDSFESGLLEYPQYTRPEEFEGMRVPEILLSGNHQLIDNWRKEKSLEVTRKLRPDLLEKK